MIVNIEIDENDRRSKERFLQYIGRVTSKPIKRTYDLDKAFCTSAKLAYNYLTLFLDKEWYFDPLRRDRFHGGPVDSTPKLKNPENCKLSEDLENVFSKNTLYAMNYLVITNQKHFSNSSLNKKIMKRIESDPHHSFFYAKHILNERLSREKEKVFLKNNKAMYHYASLVIKGKFDPEIEKTLKLKTFSKEYMESPPSNPSVSRWNRKDIDYLRLYFQEDNNKSCCYFYIKKMCKF
jgi:hypothetical protein